MLAVVRAVALRLDAASVPWLLAGSAARLLRGAPVRPGDIDVEVGAHDAARAAAALGLPHPAPAEGGGWRSLRAEGAINGVPVDLSGGITITGPGGTLTGPDPASAASPGDQAGASPAGGPVGPIGPWSGITLLPEGEALARAVVSGDDARRARAEDALPGDAAARAAARAYAESRIAAAASAAR